MFATASILHRTSQLLPSATTTAAVLRHPPTAAPVSTRSSSSSSWTTWIVVKSLQRQDLYNNGLRLFSFFSSPSLVSRPVGAVRASGTAKKTMITNPNNKTFSSTSSSSNGGGGGGGFLAWYEGHLHKNPIWTKMCTGAFLWGVGDAVAQIVPPLVSSSSGQQKGSIMAKMPNFNYDWIRTGRAAIFGFALHAPLSHVHFNFLEWMTVKAGITGLQIPIFKAFMEQFVYWSWFSNSLYHGAMGAMQGMTPQQCYDRIYDVLWETQIAQWKFWIPIQLLNFQFVPIRHQLNVVLLTSIVWTALLSAWYPPQEEEEDKEEEQAFLKVEAARVD